jgi:hypothetical protein
MVKEIALTGARAIIRKYRAYLRTILLWKLQLNFYVPVEFLTLLIFQIEMKNI